jgi:hypothetical protein
MVSAEFNILYFNFIISFTHPQVLENGKRMQHDYSIIDSKLDGMINDSSW